MNAEFKAKMHVCSSEDFIKSRGIEVCRICGVVSVNPPVSLDFPTTRHGLDNPALWHNAIETGIMAVPGGYNKDMRVYNNEEHRKINTIGVIKELSNSFHLRLDIIKRAVYIASKMLRKTNCGRSVTTIAIAEAAIYMATSEINMGLKFKDIEDALKQNNHESHSNVSKRLICEFKDMVGYQKIRISGPSMYITRLKNSIEFRLAFNKIFEPGKIDYFFKILEKRVIQRNEANIKKTGKPIGHAHNICVVIHALERDIKNAKNLKNKKIFSTKFLAKIMNVSPGSVHLPSKKAGGK